MHVTDLPRHFKTIGARLEVADTLRPRLGRETVSRPYELDIARDKHGEHFRLRYAPSIVSDYEILQARKDERHLLLLAKTTLTKDKDRLLCGHDERHWFVAAVGEPVSTVTAARRALLPRQLRHQGLTISTLKSRANHIFKRQGEWFFVPVTGTLTNALDNLIVHRDEPIQRGSRAKPHRCDELIRFGGTAVVLWKGKEYSDAEWATLQQTPGFRVTGRAEHRMKDMTVYVRGGIHHPDHATLVLDGWHEVLLNGEIASSNVTFYD